MHSPTGEPLRGPLMWMVPLSTSSGTQKTNQATTARGEETFSAGDKIGFVDRELNVVIPSMTDRDAPIVTTVAGAIRDALGVDPVYVASPGSYDQKHIDRIGTLKNCIAYGPGVLELAHKPDEWVGVGDMLDSARVMARSLQTLLLDTPDP